MATKADLGIIRLVCNKGCGRVRRDIKNDVNESHTKFLLKTFGVKSPNELQAVYICKTCRNGKKSSKKAEVSVAEPTPEAQTEATNDTYEQDSTLKFLIPATETNYISRKIGGKNDLDILKSAFDYNIKNANETNLELFNVLIHGNCGSGKTHLARYFSYKMKLPYKRLNLNGATTPEELVGQFIPNGHERTFKWVDGWLTKFMRHGGILVVDEINMAQPEILAILNPILDRERTLILTMKDGEVIKAHPKFMLISTMNLNYEGTRPLNEALKDRFNLTLEFDYEKKVESRLIKNAKLLEFADKLRISFQNQELMTPISTRTLLSFERNIETFGKAVAEEILFNRFEKSERKAVEEIWRVITNLKNSGSSNPTSLDVGRIEPSS